MREQATWKTQTLGDVCLFVKNGLAIKQSKTAGGLPITRIETISKSVIDPTKVGRADVKVGDHDGRFLEEGDILFSHINSLSHLGKCAMYENDPPQLIHGMNLLCLRANPALVNSKFLLRTLRTPRFRSKMLRHVNPSVNQCSVSTTKLKSVKISFPLLAEQKRIAAILDKADAIRQKRKEAIKLTEELLRSTFLEMFGDPVTNPKGWPIVEMSTLVEESQYGTSERANVLGKGLPILRMNNLTSTGKINLESLKWVELTEADKPKRTTRRGDLLFNRTNSPALVGKTAVWPFDDIYAIAGYLIRIRFDESKALPDFISAFLNSEYGKKYLFVKAKASNNMSNYSASEFKKIPIFKPPLDLQEKYALFVSKVLDFEERQKNHQKQAGYLFNSLVQKAFRGEL